MLLMTCILSACRFCPWCLLTFLADSDPARTVCLGLMQRLDPKGLEKLRKDCLGLFAGHTWPKPFRSCGWWTTVRNGLKLTFIQFTSSFGNLCKGQGSQDGAHAFPTQTRVSARVQQKHAAQPAAKRCPRLSVPKEGLLEPRIGFDTCCCLTTRLGV